MTELERYRSLLADLEQAALSQAWADKRPWQVATHVGSESGVVVVDLHDLKAKVARQAVQVVLQAGPPESGAVVFVYGRGRHSVGPGSVLRPVVEKELRRACASVEGWSYRALGPARFAWITDRERAPGWLLGRTGCWGWLLGGLFVVAFAVAVAAQLGWLG